MIQMTQIVIGDIVTLQQRAKYQGAVGSMSGVAAALGPLIGGLLTTKVSWRWAFWINLPTGAISGILILFVSVSFLGFRFQADAYLASFMCIPPLPFVRTSRRLICTDNTLVAQPSSSSLPS